MACGAAARREGSSNEFFSHRKTKKKCRGVSPFPTGLVFLGPSSAARVVGPRFFTGLIFSGHLWAQEYC